MLDIMKAIYDMMGKCTYPVLKEETPHQHVEIFFQARTLEPLYLSTPTHTEGYSTLCSTILTMLFSPQKMDKNKDGVVTIDEFIDCCQNVRDVFSERLFLRGLSVML